MVDFFLCATSVSSVPPWLVFVGVQPPLRHRGHEDFTEQFEWGIALDSGAKPLDCLQEDLHASLEFRSGDKLAGSMRDAYVARTEDHGFSA